ncbi:hypothetical protein Agub_g10920 [Astrephomene gubernaculifera]|uniref:Nudix hydrolase domain-containing protein n=1 Tax=Astrephomene gubernaculifera TaxID=47775 RepID=A0AAD3DYH2_9CHLO|nr:hypothetical protein Agub_g10920 [Astrephomene gubernaculifera]
MLKGLPKTAGALVGAHVRVRLPCKSATRISTTIRAAAVQQQEYCVIVDEHNRVVGAKPRDVTVRNRLLGRGSYVLVSNPEGQLLVSKRSSSKDVYPGYWDVVVSGVVRAGEEYEDTAARELAEEIGVSEAAARAGLRRLFVFPYRDSSCHVWGCAFAFTHEGGPLQLQQEEVDWAGFRSWDQVSAMMAEEQFTPVGRRILELFQQQQQTQSTQTTTPPVTEQQQQ